MTELEAKRARYEQFIPPLHHTQNALWGMVDEKMMFAACDVMASRTKCHFRALDEDSIAMMLNYCCFNLFFEGGRTLVDVYVGQHLPENEDERLVQEAHQRSWFSLFELLRLEPDIGAHLRDLFTDENV